ncbi:MAG TPA: hypothetical protein VIR98_01540 [Candidatus Paceibacterota bacterium]
MSEENKKIVEAARSVWGERKVRVAASVAIGMLVLLFVFRAGMAVGFHKASFAFRGGDMFYRAFEGRAQGPRMIIRDDFSAAHGVAGRIVMVSLPTFTVAVPDQSEKTVVISSSTALRRFRGSVQATDIRPDDFAVVLGDPDGQGRIEARFIRLAPPPATTTSR